MTLGGTCSFATTLLTAWILRAAIPETSQLAKNEHYNGTVVSSRVLIQNKLSTTIGFLKYLAMFLPAAQRHGQVMG